MTEDLHLEKPRELVLHQGSEFTTGQGAAPALFSSVPVENHDEGLHGSF